MKNLITSFILGLSAGIFYTIPSKPSEQNTNHDLVIHKNIDKDLPPSLRLYYWINFYSDSLDIPINYLYGVANTETSWDGPLDFTYKPNLKSFAGALGPMQIMPGTAKMILGKSVTNTRLSTDIQLNVRISAILLKKLHKQYGDWKVVFGAYNTGRPLINGYSYKVYNFQSNWNDSIIINLNN